MLIGDGSILEGLSTLTTENPDKFKSMGGPTDPVPFCSYLIHYHYS
jgi:SSS family solute:Na+ symporter